MARPVEEVPYTPPPASQMLEEKYPYEWQMAKLRTLLDQVRPPAPPPPPTRWQMFVNALRGRS